MGMQLSGSLELTGSFTTSGAIVAQTLVVQTITSSITQMTGSNIFGSSLSNRQQFTGSFSVTGSTATFAGSIGVGTASPSEKLEVNGNIKLNNGSVDGGQLVLSSLGYSDWNIDSYSGSLRSYYGASVATTITAAGNVGIGTTSPSSQLHIIGASTNIFADGLRVQRTSGTNQYGVINYKGGALNILAVDQSGNNLPEIDFLTSTDGTNTTTRMVIMPTGYVGINSTSPASRLYVQTTAGATKAYDDTTKTNIMVFDDTSMAAGVGGSITFGGYKTAQTNGGNFAAIDGVKENGTAGNEAGTFRIWTANSSGIFSERMRVTSLGYVKASPTGVYIDTAGTYHEFRGNGANSYELIASNYNSSPASQYVISARFSASTPNNTSARFLDCEDSTATRAYIRSNGGLSNYQANDTNLSDIRTKKEIILCESYWDKFKAIEIVKFKYKDQTHDDFNIGVIAQQVEEVAPEFIDEEDWAKPGEESKIMKSIYTADLNHATIKVLQEAIAKIEQLEARVKELENK